MSTDASDAFSAPPDRAAVHRSVLELLASAFNPKSPLERPAPPSDIALDGGRDMGRPLVDVLDDVREHLLPTMVQTRHPWTMAHMVPPPATVSVLADLLIGAFNQCAFLWEEGPSAAPLEVAVTAWLSEQVGYGPAASGLLTSGGTDSNLLAAFLAVAAASRKNSKSRLPRERMCIVASDQAHFSWRKATALLGLGDDGFHAVPTDREGRLAPGAFHRATARALRAGKLPILVVTTAGTTNAGVVECAAEANGAARACGAWSHVDAAHGGFMCLLDGSARLRRSWGRADSLSWDPHKTLYTSYSVGSLLLRHPDARADLHFASEYALGNQRLDDAGADHFDGSRRLEALKLWMTIRHLGRDGLAKLAERTVQLAAAMAAEVQRRPDFELCAAPDTNIVCFRYVDPAFDGDATEALNARLQRELFLTGGPLLSTTRLGARLVLRAVLLNPRLATSAVPEVLDRIACAGARLAGRALPVL